MNAALIFAGGAGRRMNPGTKPKQFLELHGKPVIIYTLEHFEEHYEIDNILVVCIKGWVNELQHMLDRYAMHKVGKVVLGGATGHESIYNGLMALNDICAADDIVLIHDGVRPLINSALISNNIAAAKAYGAAVTVEAATESVVRVAGDNIITEVPPRAEMFTAKAPQTFKYGLIWDIYQRAKNDGILSIDSAHLCGIYGIEMRAVCSTPNNIKITAPQDYYIFRALYEAMENQQILGI